jgi:hypothetical protein
MDASYYLLDTSSSSTLTSSLVLDEKKTKEVLNKIVLESVDKIVNVSNHIISEKNSIDSSKNDFGGLKIFWRYRFLAVYSLSFYFWQGSIQ